MNKVTVKRDELLNILITNRDSHRQTFEKALDVYRERILKVLEKRIEDVRKGRKIEHFIKLPEPEDHTQDYQRVIKMVEMSITDEIELSSSDFSQYVMDSWSWRESFLANTSSYLVEKD